MYVKLKTMTKLLFLILFIHCAVSNSYFDEDLKTLHGYEDPPDGRKTFTFKAESHEFYSAGNRKKRATDNSVKSPLADNGIITKVCQFFSVVLLVD